MSFSQVSRYYEFILVVLKRYDEASVRFLENTKALQARIRSGTHPTTAEGLQLLEEGARLNILLHLEIESFYILSKFPYRPLP